jgi:hypothetical protein
MRPFGAPLARNARDRRTDGRSHGTSSTVVQVYGALSLNKTNDLRNSIFRRDRDHHVNMVGHQMLLLDPALLLFSQFSEYIPKILPQPNVQRLASALGDKNNVVFAVPLAVV